MHLLKMFTFLFLFLCHYDNMITLFECYDYKLSTFLVIYIVPVVRVCLFNVLYGSLVVNFKRLRNSNSNARFKPDLLVEMSKRCFKRCSNGISNGVSNGDL